MKRLIGFPVGFWFEGLADHQLFKLEVGGIAGGVTLPGILPVHERHTRHEACFVDSLKVNLGEYLSEVDVAIRQVERHGR